MRLAVLLMLLAWALAGAAGCGKKGAPVPPARPLFAPTSKAKPAEEPAETKTEEARRKEPLLPP